MKLVSNSLALPLIFGLSLTGVCVGIFYFLYKKDEEETEKTITLREIKNITYEIKISRQYVPAIIGRRGATIKDIEERTSTRIRFNEDNHEAQERICSIRGTLEAIKLAETMIQSLITDLPIIETYETFIPQRIVSKLLEKKGKLINDIQSSTNTKIILEKGYNYDPDAQKRVLIKGTAEKIAEAVLSIEDQIKEAKNAIEKLKLGRSPRSSRGKAHPRNTINNNSTEILQKQLSDFSITQDRIMEVYVSAVENPSQFWVQVVGEGTFALDKLVDNMTTYYDNEENKQLHILKNISVGQTVAAKFSFDNSWYRAEVIVSMGNDLYEVYFVDYGDQEIVEAQNILELRTDFLSFRFQAIECCIANIKPKDEEWSQEACDRFHILSWTAQWQILTAKVRGYKERVIGQGKSRREGSPIPCVELFDKNNNQDINIGKQLVIENLAIGEETAWSAVSSTLSLSKQNNNFSTSTTIANESVSNASISSISSYDISPKNGKKITQEVIDLITPKKKNSSNAIEEIDLVTPNHKNSTKFIDGQKISSNHKNEIKTSYSIPADLNSDEEEEDSDELEMG